MLLRCLKEPLLHFLIVGLVIFVTYDPVGKPELGNQSNRILVDRARLLTFMQYRAKAFGVDRFDKLLNELPAEQRQSLIDDYIREEVLYREAKALKLDANDYVARKRLIQQMEFITQGVIASSTALSESDLKTFLDNNIDNYVIPAKTTFTHVFFRGKNRSDDQTKIAAEQQLKILNDKHIPFHDALSYGDRFLYHRNYVNKDASEIASHFGKNMQSQIFKLKASDITWHGPFISPYGFHLVMMTKNTPSYVPALDEVRQKVEFDAMQAKIATERTKAIQSIVDDYEVEIDDSFKVSLATESPLFLAEGIQ